MSSRIVRRRAAKAARRKQILAERRKLTLAEKSQSLAAQVRRLAGAPLHSCLVTEGLFGHGDGNVVLTRKTGSGRLAFASFLIDVYCLGVKDVIFREAEMSEIGDMIGVLEYAAPLAPADPSYARKLLHDLTAWARALGFEPHADYAAVEPLFGDSLAEACNTSFHFGRDGRPCYVPGPFDTPAQIRRRVEQLRRHLGEDGFDFLVPTDGDEEFEDEEGAAGYDPHRAPDPAEWLALDEGERLSRIEESHLNAESDMPNLAAHAALHLTVENQIALGEPPAVRGAVTRLTAEGLDRHEALHAVACVLVEQMPAILQEDTSPASADAYATALEKLTAESWRRYWEEDEPDGA